jgi:serine/threonine protein kinase
MEGRGTQEGRVKYPVTATMSEPAGHSDGLHDIPDRAPADAPSAAAASLDKASALDPLALFANPPPPTDDAPTVISKLAPRAVPNDEMLAGILRGKKLAHFELLEAVGVGGMAAVLRARDTQLDRIVALKILPPDMAADVENVRRFHQEARSAAKLDHENIARVFFCGEDQSLHFIAFEYVEGENLRALIDRHARLRVGDAVHYMLQIATGLAHAAERGVVHRDIKPSNLIITPTGRAKLVDMGLARSLAPHHDGALTQSGVTLGTFDYISPEQAIEPREADVRSDIYSLGCTFYHALTGQPPVPEGTAAKKLHHHQQIAPLDPRQLNPDIPDEVAAILARMMAKDPKARYQRPEHLVQHLLGVAQKLGAAANLPQGVLYVDAALPEPPRVRPLLLAAIGVAAVVALVLLFGSTPWTSSGTGNPNERQPVAAKDGSSAGATIPPPNVEPHDQNAVPTVANHAPAMQEFDSPTLRELADFVANHPDKDAYDMALRGDVWLTGNDTDADADNALGLLAPGKKLTLHAAKDAARPPTVHITYTGAGRFKTARWMGLLLRAEEITLRGLRIVIDAKSADTHLAGLVLQGSRLYVTDCEFVQVNPSSSESERTTSLLIDGTRPGLKPQALIDGTVFLGGKALAGDAGGIADLQEATSGGQDAVTIAGAANLTAVQCAIGPHAAPFHFEGGERGSSSLKLRECSTIVTAGDWTAFRFAEGASCEPLEVQRCLFARPESDPPAPEPMMMMDLPRKPLAALIRQAGLGRVRYEGRDNRYYRLDAFWLRAVDDLTATTWSEFQNEVRRQGGSAEEKSGLLATSPWLHEKPLELLQKPDSADSLRDAFRLKDNQRILRQKENAGALVGVSKGVWGASYEKLPVLEETNPPAPIGRELTVDPSATPGGTTFKHLNAALEYASPGDVILIKYNGPFPLSHDQRHDQAVSELSSDSDHWRYT